MEEIENIENKEILTETENVEDVVDIGEKEFIQSDEIGEENPEVTDGSSVTDLDEDVESQAKSESGEETVIESIPPNPNARWYAIRTYTGHESKVKLSIESEIKRLRLQDKIFEVIIPQETVFEVRGGKRRTKIKNFLPGYIIINALMDKKIIEIITNVPSVVSFVGNKSQPAPLQTHEIERIIGRVEERRSIATIVTSFEIGDPVKVIDGPFTNFNGTVKEVNHEKQKLKVEVGILGRKTPVELDFSQVELENH